MYIQTEHSHTHTRTQTVKQAERTKERENKRERETERGKQTLIHPKQTAHLHPLYRPTYSYNIVTYCNIFAHIPFASRLSYFRVSVI